VRRLRLARGAAYRLAVVQHLTRTELLLTSFRARSPLYRGYLKYSFAMARLNRKARWAVIIGLYLSVRFAGLLPGGWVLVAIYFLFVLWVWVARPEQKSVVARQIEVGATTNGLVEVRKGISVGETVVASGALFIDRAATRD